MKEQWYKQWKQGVAEINAIKKEINRLRDEIFVKSIECGRYANRYYLATNKTETTTARQTKEQV